MSGASADGTRPPRTTVRHGVTSRGPGGPAVLVVVALVLGVGIGRSLQPDPGAAATRALERDVLPVVLDADAVWLGPTADGVAVSAAIAALRAGDPEPVAAGATAWLAAYDTVLVRLVGVELPDPARPIQRQFIAGVTLSRDAVELVQWAAQVPPGRHRADLLDEAVRLRLRSEQLVLSARASVADLDGARRRIALLPTLPGLGSGEAGS